MKKQHIEIESIPAILWGDKSDKLFIAVHGNMSNKADDVIVFFADQAINMGYQVLSFDLPKHGERKKESTPCKVQNCIHDLANIIDYARSLSDNISVFACSMGAYFSLLAYKHERLYQSLFLSPVVDMESIITNLMKWFDITEERLMNEEEIATPIGEVLYWDYYCYVKANPVVEWEVLTSILYGSEDNICEFDIISSFTDEFNCDLVVLNNGEHYFHTEKQLSFFKHWVKDRLLVNQGERLADRQ